MKPIRLIEDYACRNKFPKEFMAICDVCALLYKSLYDKDIDEDVTTIGELLEPYIIVAPRYIIRDIFPIKSTTLRNFSYMLNVFDDNPFELNHVDRVYAYADSMYAQRRKDINIIGNRNWAIGVDWITNIGTHDKSSVIIYEDDKYIALIRRNDNTVIDMIIKSDPLKEVSSFDDYAINMDSIIITSDNNMKYTLPEEFTVYSIKHNSHVYTNGNIPNKMNLITEDGNFISVCGNVAEASGSVDYDYIRFSASPALVHMTFPNGSSGVYNGYRVINGNKIYPAKRELMPVCQVNSNNFDVATVYSNDHKLDAISTIIFKDGTSERNAASLVSDHCIKINGLYYAIAYDVNCDQNMLVYSRYSDFNVATELTKMPTVIVDFISNKCDEYNIIMKDVYGNVWDYTIDLPMCGINNIVNY